MRLAPLLLLAACTSSARVRTQAPVAEAPASAPAPLPAPAPAVIPSATTYEHDGDAAAVRATRTFALPPRTAAALQRERVRGQVLVAGPLFPTEIAAKGLVATMDADQPVAMKVVADKGKVIQVTTTAGADCVEGFAQHYELSVFVPRSSLVPRTTAEITKAFDDGTAYAIDRGAPVKVTAAGLAWFDPLLDQTSAAPPERLAYSLAKPYAPAAVPSAPGERLVCDRDPMTKSEWMAKKQIELDRAAAQTTAASRRIADARAAKKAGGADAVDGLVDLVLDDGAKAVDAARVDAPYCSIAKPAAAKLGGAPYVWTDVHGDEAVYQSDRGYVAEVRATCARARVAVGPSAVRRVPAADVAAIGKLRQRVWIPKAGPVFWPDGKKAGKYTGKDQRFYKVSEHDDLVCVGLRGVAEEVCHRKADVTVEN